jgi:hypothetical protein
MKQLAHFIQTLLAIYLSRKFIVTMTFLAITHGIYWQATAELFAFTTPDQIHAFTTIFQTAMATIGSIVLGYLGFSKTSPNLASYVQPYTPPKTETPVDRSWKSDPNAR